MRALPASTVGAYFRRAVNGLRKAGLHYGHGTHNARDEAAYLILHTLGLPLESLAPYLDRKLTAGEQKHLDSLFARRIATRTPSAYLIHEAWLGDFSFYVDRRTIIPRSFIFELLRDGLRPWRRGPVGRILDLCTGSGCLAIVAAHVFPAAKVDAVDISERALAVARRNVDHYRLRSRVRLLKSDLFEALGGTRYDLILCNPPYVTSQAMRALPREHRHEPRLALAGGRDGLDVVRRILRETPDHLAARGLLVCEIGHNRRTLERAYPSIPFLWPDLSAGPGHVFIAEREHLQGAGEPPRAKRRGR